MTTFESEVKKANCNEDDVYAIISNLNSIDKFKNMIPEDKIKDVSYDNDSCHFEISPIGKLGVKIIDREPSKTVKYAADNSPIDFNLWVQLKQVAENDTRIKLTIKADLNPVVKMMVSSYMDTMLNKLADALANLPYQKLK